MGHSLIFLGLLLAAGQVFTRELNPFDEGAIVHIAERIARGEVLYRDVDTAIMPGVYYLHALLFRVFGPSLLVGRIASMVVFALTGTLIYHLALGFAPRSYAVVSTLIFALFGIIYYIFPNYFPDAALAALTSLWIGLRYRKTRQPLLLILVGALLGLTLLFKQSIGTFALVALTGALASAHVTLFKDPGVSRAGPPLTFELFAVAVGLLAVVLPWIGYFAYHGALGEALHGIAKILLMPARQEFFYKPFPGLTSDDSSFIQSNLFNYAPFPFALLWLLERGHIGGDGAVALVKLIYYAPLVVLLAAALHIGVKLAKRHVDDFLAMELMGVLYGGLLFLGAFPRTDAYHLLMSCHTIFILAPRMAYLSVKKARAFSVFAAVPLSLLCIVLPLFNLFLYMKGTPALWDAVLEERGAGVKVRQSAKRHIASIIHYIQATVPPEEPILVVPDSPLYYFLAERQNATRFPLMNAKLQDEAEIMKVLEEGKVRYIVYSDAGYDNFSTSKLLPTVHKYLSDHYHVDEHYLAQWVPISPYVLKRGKERARFMAFDFPQDAIRAGDTKGRNGEELREVRFRTTVLPNSYLVLQHWDPVLLEVVIRQDDHEIRLQPEPEAELNRYAGREATLLFRFHRPSEPAGDVELVQRILPHIVTEADDWPILYDFVDHLHGSSKDILFQGGGQQTFDNPFLVRPAVWLLHRAMVEVPIPKYAKTSISFPVKIPEAAALRFAVALVPPAVVEMKHEAVLFEVYIYDPARSHVEKLFGRHLLAKERSAGIWRPYLLDLGKFAGREVQVMFLTSRGPQSQGLQATPLWGAPAIVRAGGAASAEGIRQAMAAPQGLEVPRHLRAAIASFDGISMFMDAVKLAPEDFEARLTLGRILLKWDRVDQAVTEFGQALQIQPDAPLAYAWLAQAYRRQGRVELALQAYERALALQPDQAEALLGLGMFYLDQGQEEVAARWFERAVKVAPHLHFSITD